MMLMPLETGIAWPIPRSHATPRSAPIAPSAISRSRASRRRLRREDKRAAPIFVVQKHSAHRAGLHWDFRLEHGGVLWSWAVRKGPSLDPADKRMAAHVEDHPLDYADFEGTIPDGQYGAGTVELWDRGTWEPLDDPEAGMRKGELRFVLDGKRLHGRFTLVRLKPRPGQRGRQDNWLLIKGHDEAEREGADAPTIERSASPPGGRAASATSRRRKVRSAASCRSGRRRSLRRWRTSRRRATTGSAKSSSTAIACCAGSITARCAW